MRALSFAVCAVSVHCRLGQLEAHRQPRRWADPSRGAALIPKSRRPGQIEQNPGLSPPHLPLCRASRAAATAPECSDKIVRSSRIVGPGLRIRE